MLISGWLGSKARQVLDTLSKCILRCVDVVSDSVESNFSSTGEPILSDMRTTEKNA